MILRLPDELRTQVIAHPVAPVEIIDEETQVESAMEAGWNDVAMDDYNDYDSHRQAS